MLKLYFISNYLNTTDQEELSEWYIFDKFILVLSFMAGTFDEWHCNSPSLS